MSHRNIGALLLLALVVAACSCGRRAPGRQATIAATGDEQGEIHDCGCAAHPAGGLARRVAYLRELRRERADRALIVEAGDFLVGEPPRAEEERRAAADRARLIAAAYRAAGCDAVLFGKRDLTLGLPLLRELAATIGAPALGANVIVRDGVPLAGPSTVVERGGLRLGLLGLVAPPTPAELRDGLALPADVELRSPVEMAVRFVADLRQTTDVVILVVNMDNEMLAKVLDAAPGVDFVLQTGAAAAISQRVDTQRGAAIVSLFRGGRFVGRLDLALTRRGAAFAGVDDREILEQKIKRNREALDALAREAGGAERISEHFAGRAEALSRARRLREDIAAWTRERNELGATGNRYGFELIELSAAVGEDAAAAAAVAAYDKGRPSAARQP